MNDTLEPNDDEDEAPLDDSRRRYEWYIVYDEDDEYEEQPEWSEDVEIEEIEEDDGNPYTKPKTKFFNRFDPERIWIKSDTTWDLDDMR